MITNEFIKACKIVHGNKYDYSKTIFTRKCDKICVTCHKHGDWNPTAFRHLNEKTDCPKCCGVDILSKNRAIKYSLNEFIEKANEVHNNKYDYSLVNYINSKTKIEILCKKHSLFIQRPAFHLFGYGCPKCGHEKK